MRPGLWQAEPRLRDALLRARQLLQALPAAQPSSPAALTLDEEGLILDCSPVTERLFGYVRHDLLGRHVSKLLPDLAKRTLVQGDQVEPRLAYLSRCRTFQARCREGESIPCELFFNRLGNPGAAPLLLLVREAGARRIRDTDI